MKFIVACFVLILLSCNNRQVQNRVLSDKWVNDTHGCKQLRTKELALELINSNQLMNDTKEQFLNVFQAPDKITYAEGKEVFTYYFTSTCEHGKLVTESDMCYASFYFKADKLIETSFACE